MKLPMMLFQTAQATWIAVSDHGDLKAEQEQWKQGEPVALFFCATNGRGTCLSPEISRENSILSRFWQGSRIVAAGDWN
jgi:hypothetical protein